MLADDGDPAEIQDAISVAAQTVDADDLADVGFSAQVVTAQLRSIAVDLLQATGLDHEQARRLLPPMQHGEMNHPDH